MNRRNFIPALALLPVVAKQLVVDASAVQPNQCYGSGYNGCYILCANGVRYQIVDYHISGSTFTVDKCIISYGGFRHEKVRF